MIRIGTCSWKYDSWQGLIYPLKKAFNYLEEYSKSYNTVEIDQWFWSLFDSKAPVMPKQQDVIDYSGSVPDNFKFTIKIPNSITLTHYYNKNKNIQIKPNPYFLNAELFNSFIDKLNPMQNKIGVLMFQFEYLNREKISGLTELLERFEVFIDSIDRKYPLAVEIRNPNYLKKQFFDFLNKNDLAMVFIHGYYMPPIWEVYNEFKEEIKSRVVIRLHGPDRNAIEQKSGGIWNKIIFSRDEELDKISEIIFSLNNKETDIFVNVNNHFEGSAPLTIKKIKDKLKNV